ncbi:dehydroquinate synthase/iron-containing alcohol dehydrogenase family protein [Mesorhizobium comanense]|uniref:iron-containing alcohol dehydrogenase n=1 Tax=Mesorhizobium comanense TaxID=2502215 RepID=UPI0010F875F5|nr:iron-containing alcohol dehydrogenase [Mesorhizobium comanense]
MAIGRAHDTHHRLLNAVLMSNVVRFNAPAMEEKLSLLARFPDLPSHDSSAMVDWIIELRRQLNTPATLPSIDLTDIDEERVARFSAPAATSRWLLLYLRVVVFLRGRRFRLLEHDSAALAGGRIFDRLHFAFEPSDLCRGCAVATREEERRPEYDYTNGDHRSVLTGLFVLNTRSLRRSAGNICGL